MSARRLSRAVFPDERLDRAHSFEVERSLHAAYHFLRRKQYELARVRITPVRFASRSPWQFLRMLYIEALAARETHRLALSAALFDHALRVALDLDAREDFGLLAAELATAHYYCTDFEQAAAAARLGIEAESTLSCPRSEAHRALETELHHRFGICMLQLEDFATAHLYLFTAYHVADTLPALAPHAVKKAKICWDIALWYHLTDHLPQARSFAEQGVPLLATFGDPHVCARLEVALAGMLLEQAAPHGAPKPFAGREYLLDKAQSLLASARVRFAVSMDAGGQALETLARARLSRLLGREEDRIALVESVLRDAEESGDTAFIGKCNTALGLELLALEEPHQGVACLRRAVEAFDASPGPAESILTRRALYVAEEMRG